MKFIPMIAGVTAAAFVAISLASTPAEAAKRKYRGYSKSYVATTYRGGARTRIYVSKRSWLDAGTEVLPGERKFNDYAYPMNSTPGPINDNRSGYRRQPLADPWDIPGFSKF